MILGYYMTKREKMTKELIRYYAGSVKCIRMSKMTCMKTALYMALEDGIIGCRRSGLRGFAGIVNSAANNFNVKLEHIGIIDPRIAPSDGHMEVWQHFGLSSEALIEAVKSFN